MRIFFAALVLVAFAAGGWFLMKPASPDTTAQTQADDFAQSALAGYGASQTQAQSDTSASSSPTADASSTPVTNTTSTNQTNQPDKKYMHATLHTNQGDITIEFTPADAPTAVANFTKLAGSGFYDGTKFHRVIAGFMIQGGDPLSKDDSQASRWGTGGPGYQFNDEITANSKNNIGVVAMANSGPNTNGSQFYINVANNNFLDGKYVTFGKVTSGMDVVTKIEKTPTDKSNDRPLSPMHPPDAIVLPHLSLHTIYSMRRVLASMKGQGYGYFRERSTLLGFGCTRAFALRRHAAFPIGSA
jgi:cyclophilin family peptidyl-prolyl cis-trans isomerase